MEELPLEYPQNLRRDRAMRQSCEHVVPTKATNRWPMESYEKPPFPPPWPSERQRAEMRRESADIHPEKPLGPLAEQWTKELHEWYEKLQHHFAFDPTDLAANVRRSADRWERRLQYLRSEDNMKFQSVMHNIRQGHRIPLESEPQKYFRSRNPPSLTKDKVRAWEAIIGDIEHGAIIPVNLDEEGVPWCVCPVRTADKSNGKARFVHNSRRVNTCVPEDESTCELESLMKIRNMYVPHGFAIGSDYASGYHCLYMHRDHVKYLAFALHKSELTEEAWQWLMTNHPQSYLHRRRAFIFRYAALPFGLSTSCRAFNDMITALAGFWRTCASGTQPTRVSSYIDDVHGVHSGFSEAMWMAINMVYEAAALGLHLRIPKCSFFPRHAIKVLGTIVDLEHFVFRVSGARAEKIQRVIGDLRAAVTSNPREVPAKRVAAFVGLIWSVATSCHRAASVMTRAITATLSTGIRSVITPGSMPLKRLLARFWSGSVEWTEQADKQLTFWSNVDFLALEAPISADVLGKSAEAQFRRPSLLDNNQVAMLFQDASATASGGGVWSPNDPRARPERLHIYEFSTYEAQQSSTFREILGIFKCLISMNTTLTGLRRVLFGCDNWSSVSAVKFGSRNPAIQTIAEKIFEWCLRHNVVVWPVWLPRTSDTIREADRLSRLTIPHDQRSPQRLCVRANEIALSLWQRPISFDQAASHKSRIQIDGQPLPFNAFCCQPGASGVDMFERIASWIANINYVYPPGPMLGRLITFLPSTKARSILVFPTPWPQSWWSFAVQPGAAGVLHSEVTLGFRIVAFDFSCTTPYSSNPRALQNVTDLDPIKTS